MCIRIHIRYVTSSLAVVIVFIDKSESKIARDRFYGGGHEGKYSSDIRLYSYEFSNFESNSGKTFEYSKFRIRIEYSSHP